MIFRIYNINFFFFLSPCVNAVLLNTYHIIILKITINFHILKHIMQLGDYKSIIINVKLNILNFVKLIAWKLHLHTRSKIKYATNNRISPRGAGISQNSCRIILAPECVHPSV